MSKLRFVFSPSLFLYFFEQIKLIYIWHRSKCIHLQTASMPCFPLLILRRPWRERSTNTKRLHSIVTIVECFPAQSSLFYSIAPPRPCPPHRRDVASFSFSSAKLIFFFSPLHRISGMANTYAGFFITLNQQQDLNVNELLRGQ